MGRVMRSVLWCARFNPKKTAFIGAIEEHPAYQDAARLRPTRREPLRSHVRKRKREHANDPGRSAQGEDGLRREGVGRYRELSEDSARSLWRSAWRGP